MVDEADFYRGQWSAVRSAAFFIASLPSLNALRNRNDIDSP
jgi:hypothetical protein